MSKIVAFILANWQAIVGVFGLGLSIAQALRKSAAKLSYQSETSILIGKSEGKVPSEVTVLYKNESVEQLVGTDLVIWNSGAKTIRGSDVVESEPLRILLAPEDRVLEVGVLTRTREANSFEVSSDTTSKNVALLSFDYLDPNDGVEIRVLHEVSAPPTLAGTIRELPKGVTFDGRIIPSSPLRSTLKGVLLWTIGGLWCSSVSD